MSTRSCGLEDDSPEHHLSQYNLGRQIGSGAFGSVHLGTNHQTGLQVAVKLEPLSAAHPQLPHEARLYKSLSGDGVCKMFGHAEHGGMLYLVMKLYGGSLDEHLRQTGPLEPRKVVEFGLQLAHTVSGRQCGHYLQLQQQR